MKIQRLCPAAALAMLAGTAAAQPVIDGSRDNAFYGTTPLWVQNQPTLFGDNTVVLCDPMVVGNVAGVNTGVELAIPLSAIGNPAPASIRIAGFINGGGHDFLSNQAVGGMPPSTGNLGEPRMVNFANITGNQFITGAGLVANAPVIDGTRDASYGSAKFLQTVRTGFGDSTLGEAGYANGSEMAALYAVVTQDTLYIFVSGNLESNGNKLDLFIDSNAAVGQNTITTNNPNVSNNGLVRMAEEPGNPAAGPGLTFDAGFTADYFVSVNGSDNGGTYAMYVDFARMGDVLFAGDPGEGFYAGTTGAASNGQLTGGDPTAPAILATINNSNVDGVLPTCPPPAGNPDYANGSEIDGIYAKIQSGKLYLLVTGNLQTSWNKLDLFFDVQSGGQNTLRGNNPDVDFGSLNRMGDDGTGNGLTFDADFAADYWVGFTNGGNPVQIFGHAAVLRTDGKLLTPSFAGSLDYGSFDGGDKATIGLVTFDGPQIDPQDGFTPNIYSNYAPRESTEALLAVPAGTTPTGTPGLIRIAIDNSNLGGVTSTTVGNPAEVTTGIELEIDLEELGWTSGPIKVAGFINSDNRSFVSNQVIGGLPSPAGGGIAPNLGEVRAVNFATLDGVQYIIVPQGGGCYANCDGSTTAPILNVADFSCFLTKFAAQDPYANCDGSTTPPALNVADFSCFLTKFAAGCR